MNEKIDPLTGAILNPNRAGMPSRSINDLQAINTIQDPGMQSAQQANAFQRFNNVAQYMPPPTMKKDDEKKEVAYVAKSVGTHLTERHNNAKEMLGEDAKYGNKGGIGENKMTVNTAYNSMLPEIEIKG
jgi:hypothetical protein